MVSSDEVSEEYRTALSELTRNDKTQINLLTILAEDYASYASEIVEVIEDRLFKCPPQMKIVMLYVLDSIVKNIPATNSAYRDLFAKKIVDMIVHVFKESDEKTRASIYRLRCTWGDVFKRSCLYAIDIKINAVDKAWPILHPTSTGPAAQGVVHVNPLFLNGKPQQTKAEEQPRKREEKEKSKSSTKSEEKQKCWTKTEEKSKSWTKSEEKPKSWTKTEEKPKSCTKTEEKPKSWTKMERDGSQPKKEHHQAQKRKPEPLMSLNVPRPLVAPKKQQQQQQQPPPMVVPPQQQPPPLMPSRQQTPPLAMPQQQLQQQTLPMVVPQQQQTLTMVVPQQQPVPMVMPQQQPQPSPLVVPQQLGPPQQQGEQPPPPKRLRQTVWPQQQQQQQYHNIQNVTPRLPGVPENNRIFVDGKAYEVFYLDDVAVIERNGLPHRVSFAGPARDVIIDGAAHRMAFGEHKQVLIDGDVHILHFGAPSRELYMGNFAFKGAFGGPPIIATINQRRHEIRLCGPPPEVRIDPEPSYELMRYMPAVRQQQPSMVQPTKTETPSIDVSKLLKRLKETGLLVQQPTEAERKQRERQAAMEAKNAAIATLNAAPIPSNHRLDNIERRAAPMSGLEQFSMRSLIIRYDSVIDAIHRSRVVCQYCGIAFQELYNEAYQRHADWHLQNTIRMEDQKLNKGPKVVKGTRSQPWYMEEEWFNYSETETVNKAQGAGGQEGADKSALAVDDEKEMPAISAHQHATGKNRDAPSEMVESKECQMCHEQFEEYWDEEEDVWRLRDCVLSDGKAFHALCKEDVPEEPQDRDLRIKELPIGDSVHSSVGVSNFT